MKKIIKKKRVLYPVIFFGQCAIFIIIAKVFNIETLNTLFGIVSGYILSGTLLWFLLKIIKDHKAKLASIIIPFFGISIANIIYIAVASIIIAFVLLPFVALFG